MREDEGLEAGLEGGRGVGETCGAGVEHCDGVRVGGQEDGPSRKASGGAVGVGRPVGAAGGWGTLPEPRVAGIGGGRHQWAHVGRCAGAGVAAAGGFGLRAGSWKNEGSGGGVEFRRRRWRWGGRGKVATCGAQQSGRFFIVRVGGRRNDKEENTCGRTTDETQRRKHYSFYY